MARTTRIARNRDWSDGGEVGSIIEGTSQALCEISVLWPCAAVNHGRRQLHRRPSRCMVAPPQPLVDNGGIRYGPSQRSCSAMTENIETLLKESRVYRPTAKTIAAAHIKDYEKEYQKSIADPEAFWSGMAKELDWFSPWSTVLEIGRASCRESV